MRILITGSKGMLGQDLALHLAARHEALPLGRSDADITDSRAVAQAIASRSPDVVIHAAAFTAVDDCEQEPELALQVNGGGTRNVALACEQIGARMLYVSTDYVFDGQKDSPYVETDDPNPINTYGKSKLQGENYVRVLQDSWIVRVSWLFGPLGKNFVRTILGRAREGQNLRIVDDQVGAPTYTVDAAEKIEQIVESGAPGIYHVTNQGYCSWFAFAAEILAQAGLGGAPLSPISSLALGRPAARPTNSRLANARLAASAMGLLPPWQDALRRYLLREPPA
ncbi:MAG: dTDP-4-dehydrorhamnose reductase [Acidobacteria bacterium]|nr:MAG: dTDP-4-dehydrorhamnose reductase [Acidobacteriota bacterium]